MHLFSSQTTATGRIDETDTACRISTAADVGDLMFSLKQVGLLTPPLLRERPDGRYAVIAGFRRVAACRALGWERIDTRVIDAGAGDLDCCRLAIADNALHRELNLVEQANAVCKLAVFFKDDRVLAREAATCGLQASPEFIGKLKKLGSLYPQLLGPLEAGTLPLTTALTLGGLDPDSALGLLEVFDALRPTLNHQKEILTTLQEIALVENRSLPEVIAELKTVFGKEGKDGDRRCKLQDLRAFLRARRYPEMARFEAAFQRGVKALNLPDTIRIAPPLHFEDTRFTLSFSFEGMQEFLSSLGVLESLADSTGFLRLLQKLDEGE